MSRTINTVKNLATGIGLTIATTLIGFLTRKIFVDTIGVEYLGLNGLLSNILGIMALLEGGFGTSVIYNLYKPIAENNKTEIIALMQLYKKIYNYIGLGVIAIGCSIYPFIDYFVSDVSDLKYVGVVYFIFLFNSVLQYFSAYKWSLINAHQQAYKLGSINLAFQLIMAFTKISVLYFTENYILCLSLEAVCLLGWNIAIVRKANSLYPYILNAPKYHVRPEIKTNIITNMKALFLHALGGYFMHSTDNVVISAYVGLGIIGLYSNYTLIISSLGSFTSQILSSFSESVGNLIASEGSKQTYSVFKTIFFVNFIAVSIPVILLSVLATPFISWWLGPEYTLSPSILGIILFNNYIMGLRSSVLTFKTKSGIFTKDKFTPLMQGCINLILSLIFVRFWGLSGVLVATGVSVLAISFWQWPRLIYKYVFEVKLRYFFYRYLFLTGGMFLAMTCSFGIMHFIQFNVSFINLCFQGIIILIVTFAVYYACFRKMEEFNNLTNYIRVTLNQFWKKLTFSTLNA